MKVLSKNSCHTSRQAKSAKVEMSSGKYAVFIVCLSIFISACASGPRKVAPSIALVEEKRDDNLSFLPEEQWPILNKSNQEFVAAMGAETIALGPVYISALKKSCRTYEFPQTKSSTRVACKLAGSGPEWYLVPEIRVTR